MNDQEFKRDLASFKQEQGFLKHLTGLSTGSILIIITFIEKLFSSPEWKSLITVSIISFLLSVLGCVVIHFFSVMGVDNHHDKVLSKKSIIIGLLSSTLALGGFLSGIISLGLFAIKNLY